MTTVSRVVENLDGKGYGSKLEIPLVHPFVMGTLVPFLGDPVDLRRVMLNIDRTMAIIVLNRDSGSGQVVEDSRRWPRISYNVCKKDAKHIVEGLVCAAKIMVAAGAKELRWPGDPQQPAFKVGAQGLSDQRFVAWLQKLRTFGLQRTMTNLFSAHQMGTCRMAGSSQLGATKPTGETWEVRDLFVSDTSTFPTPSGSNPMPTCAAVAFNVAQEVIARLRVGHASRL